MSALEPSIQDGGAAQNRQLSPGDRAKESAESSDTEQIRALSRRFVAACNRKDRFQRFETDAQTAAFVWLICCIICGTAKRSERGGVIVPVPTRTIGKGYRAQNPRQVVHRRIRLEYFLL